MNLRSFCASVLLPVAAIMAVALVLGCEEPPPESARAAPSPVPVTPGPVVDQRPKQEPQRPTIIAFGADWCPACRAGEVRLAAMERQGVEVRHVNIDQEPAVAAAWGVTSIPVYIVSVCRREPHWNCRWRTRRWSSPFRGPTTRTWRGWGCSHV